MGIVFVLLPLSLLLALLGVLAFRWAVQDGQLDDLDSAGVRMLFGRDDEAPVPGPRAARPSPSQQQEREDG